MKYTFREIKEVIGVLFVLGLWTVGPIVLLYLVALWRKGV